MKLLRNNHGFTVLELLISSTVFSVVLLLVSVAIVGLSRQFYRGLNQSKTQEVARTISEEIAKGIQYSKSIPIPITVVDNPNATPPTSVPAGTAQAWCISDKRYAFIEGRELGPNPAQNQVPSVLLRESGCNAFAGPNLNRNPGVTEMLGENMRLANLEIRGDAEGKVWNVIVRVAFGSDEVLEDPNGATARCKTEIGQQFCAVAEYSMVVVRQL